MLIFVPTSIIRGWPLYISRVDVFGWYMYWGSWMVHRMVYMYETWVDEHGSLMGWCLWIHGTYRK